MIKEDREKDSICALLNVEALEKEIDALEGSDKLYYDALCLHRDYKINSRAKRLAMGLSQEELAQKMGVKRQVIGKVERGEANLNFSTIMKHLDALGIDINTLFKNENFELDAPFKTSDKSVLFKRNMKLKRKAMGLTQDEVAELIGGKQQVISRLEKDSSNQKFMTIIQYLCVLGVDINEIFR